MKRAMRLSSRTMTASLCEDTGAEDAADLGFCQDAEILLGRGVGSLGSRAQSLELLMSVGTADDFGDQSWELLDGHVLVKPW